MYSSFIYGSSSSNLYLSNSKFSHLLSPAIHLTNDQKNADFKSQNFHERKTNFTSDITLINCTFTYCQPEDLLVNGGAISIDTKITFISKYCTFRNNISPRAAGAVSIIGSQLVDIDNCLFAENKAHSFGALRLEECEKVCVKYTNFISNEAKTNTAAFYLSDVSGDCQILYSTFTNNSAKKGGTLIVQVCQCNIEGCVFYNNHIERGPISIRSLKKIKLLIKNTTFSETKPPAVMFSVDSEVKISQSSFAHSESSDIRHISQKLSLEDNVYDNFIEYKPYQLPPLPPLRRNKYDFKLFGKKGNNKLSRSKIAKLIHKNKNINKDEQNNEKSNDNANDILQNKIKNNDINKENNIKNDNKDYDKIIVEQKADLKNEKMEISYPLTILVVLIIALICFLIFNLVRKKAVRKEFKKLQNENNSILENDEFNANNDSFAYSGAEGDKIPDLNDENLPDLKMEKL